LDTHSKLGKAVADRMCKQILQSVSAWQWREDGLTMGASDMRSADGEQKKPPARITVAVKAKSWRAEMRQHRCSRLARGHWTTWSRRGVCQHGALAAGFSSQFPSFGSMRAPTILNGSWL